MNYDSVEVVIDFVIRRFKLREWQYDIEEIVEDVAEGLRHIGAAKVFQDKVHTLTFNNKAAALPRDCVHVKSLDPVNTKYIESGRYIQCDVADGTEIPLIYQAMPVDQRGYPVVPDNTAVREALMWYIAKILILQGELKSVPYSVAEEEWQWRCGSARAELNVMGVQAWSGVANDFTRLNPLKDQHEKGYSEVGKPNTLDRDKRQR